LHLDLIYTSSPTCPRLCRCAALSFQVAIYAGLDLSRDTSTHHLQDKLFDAHVQLARKVQLPLLARCVQAAERLADKIAEERAAERLVSASASSSSSSSSALVSSSAAAASAAAVPLPICIYGVQPGACSLQQLRTLLALDCYVTVDASFTAAPSDGDALTQWTELLRAIPLDRLLVISDSPHHTPQNIADEWVWSLSLSARERVFARRVSRGGFSSHARMSLFAFTSCSPPLPLC
jgi:Tat protein secretion system quality control protein TatD with DNase activity